MIRILNAILSLTHAPAVLTVLVFLQIASVMAATKGSLSVSIASLSMHWGGHDKECWRCQLTEDNARAVNCIPALSS